jgi:hypothetical protein
LLAVGVTVPRIAAHLRIGESSLRRHYSDLISAACRKPGPKPFEATEIQRDIVRRLAAVGTPQNDIADFVGISRATLVSHLGRELKTGALQANLAVGANLLRMATGSPDLKTTVTAAIWWSKARMSWRDSTRVETTGPNGGPIQNGVSHLVVLPDNGRDGVAES